MNDLMSFFCIIVYFQNKTIVETCVLDSASVPNNVLIFQWRFFFSENAFFTCDTSKVRFSALVVGTLVEVFFDVLIIFRVMTYGPKPKK